MVEKMGVNFFLSHPSLKNPEDLRGNFLLLPRIGKGKKP